MSRKASEAQKARWERMTPEARAEFIARREARRREACAQWKREQAAKAQERVR